MKRSFLFALGTALFSLCSAVSAQDYNWDKPSGITHYIRIRIYSEGQNKMALMPKFDPKPVNCTIFNPNDWGTKEETRAFALGYDMQSKKDEWVTFSGTFQVRARKPGQLVLEIAPHPNWKRERPGSDHDLMDLPEVSFIGVAEISSKQIAFPNNGFFPNTNLNKWGYDSKNKPKDKNLHPTILVDPTLDVPGHKYLRTRGPMYFKFPAKPNQIITIKFTLKRMEWYTALH